MDEHAEGVNSSEMDVRLVPHERPKPGVGYAVLRAIPGLHGLGVEVMGASDNVVRGGLTPKHVDVEELLSVLRIEAIPNPVVHPIEDRPGRWRYPTPGAPFELWRFEIAGSMPHTATGREIILCTYGDAGPLHHGEAGYLAPGDTIVLEGPSTVFRVAQP